MRALFGNIAKHTRHSHANIHAALKANVPKDHRLLSLSSNEPMTRNSPYVCADEASNFVVGRIHAVVMVHDEGELHPALPFLGLSPAQELHAALGVSLMSLHGDQGRHDHDAADHVEHGGVMILIAMVRFGEYVAQMSDEEDDCHLALGQEEFLLGGPAVEEGLSGHASVFSGGISELENIRLASREERFTSVRSTCWDQSFEDTPSKTTQPEQEQRRLCSLIYY